MSVPVGTPKGRATRLPDDDRPALTGSSFVSTGRRTLNRLPDLFKVRGRDTLRYPRCVTGRGRPDFAWAKSSWRLLAVNLSVDLAQLTDPVGWVRFAGRRLAASPHVLRTRLPKTPGQPISSPAWIKAIRRRRSSNAGRGRQQASFPPRRASS